LTAVTSSTGIFGILTTGIFSSVSSILTVWIDDEYIDNRTNKTDPGNVRITAKRPNANGSINNFTTQIGSGNSGYGTGHSPQVNERPLSTTNGWLISTTATLAEKYNIEAASVGDINITGAAIVDFMGWVYTAIDSTADSPSQHIAVDGVNTTIILTTLPAMYTQVAGKTTYPARTGTDIGMNTTFTTNAHLTSLYECGILVAYILPTNNPGIFAKHKFLGGFVRFLRGMFRFK
jgi:hypothetical protein